jgi:glucosamine--fructose-6-phosphate aminotransferase (isomerizing)
MCGIIGYTGPGNAVPVIIEGLKRLEYRGYDSAGIAAMTPEGLSITRCKGKIAALEEMLLDHRVSSTTAIGHTRWATHGRPSVENAHPHRSGRIVLVHNGIIENYFELKEALESEGYAFSSETDTEVLCHLIEKHSNGGGPIEESVRKALGEVRGAYAIAVMSEDSPGKIVAFRKDSPLVVGISDNDRFVASDIPAFLGHTNRVIFLEDNEMAVLTSGGVSFSNLDGIKIDKDVVKIDWNTSMAEKGGYRHFMLKEIFEQPRALADTISGRISHETGEVNLEEFGLDKEALSAFKRIFIVACGTSWHAGLVGKYLIEEVARVQVEVDIASEFRYRSPVLNNDDLFISITQSGETADTLAAQRLARELGATTLNICNVVGSTSSREADAVFYTRSGPEIGVASTKAFTSQLVALYLLAVAIGNTRGGISAKENMELLKGLMSVPDLMEKALASHGAMEEIARDLHRNKAFLFLGRGINYPIALEGALKLKEISYIHAEGYPAGEMKHGPIALIDDGYPVLVLAPADNLYEKVISNVQEIISRGGRIIVVTDDLSPEIEKLSDHILRVPGAHRLVMPMLFSIPLQLISYHIGVFLGCDVDQPRNLAKSVTVE